MRHSGSPATPSGSTCGSQWGADTDHATGAITLHISHDFYNDPGWFDTVDYESIQDAQRSGIGTIEGTLEGELVRVAVRTSDPDIPGAERWTVVRCPIDALGIYDLEASAIGPALRKGGTTTGFRSPVIVMDGCLGHRAGCATWSHCDAHELDTARRRHWDCEHGLPAALRDRANNHGVCEESRTPTGAMNDTGCATMDLVTAQATVHAYFASPAVCAFEAVAFGRWWTEYGRAESNAMLVGVAFHDDRFLALRREEGHRPTGSGYPVVMRACEIVRAHYTSQRTTCPQCSTQAGVPPCVYTDDRLRSICDKCGKHVVIRA